MEWSNVHIQNRWVVLSILVLFATVGMLLLIGRAMKNPRNEAYRKFSSEEYEFSLSYPSNFRVDNLERANISELWFSRYPMENSDFVIYMKLGGGIPQFEDLSEKAKQVLLSGENTNLSFIEGPKKVTVENVPGYGYTAKIPGTHWIKRHLFLVRENHFYDINLYVRENTFKTHQSRIKYIFDSFTFH